MQDQNNQNKNTFLSSLAAKIILALIIFAGSAIIIISGAKFIIEYYKIPSSKIIKFKCLTDSDCKLAYVGSSICLPCDTSIEEYKCFFSKEAKQIEEEWFKRLIESKILCERCLEEQQHSCICNNGKCEKIEKQLTQEVSITTDKTEYERGENIVFTVTNNSDEKIAYLQKCFIEPYVIYNFRNDSWDTCMEIESLEKCSLGYSEFFYKEISINQSVDFIWDQDKILPNLGMASFGKYKISLDFFKNLDFIKNYEETKNKFTVYSNEFTIKEKSALDPRCREKVRGIGSCKMSGIGYEFDSNLEKCVEKRVGGCSFEIPFETLEECQEICEKEQTNILISQEAIIANNQFAFDLYDKYKSEQGNIFFSPYSISTALAMTYEGARGKTAEEMQKVFYFPKDDSQRRDGYLNLYNQINKKDKEYQLSTANALWAQKDFRFLDEYFNITEKYYNGKTTNLDFIKETEKSRQIINTWVEDKTNNKIKDLIPQGVLNKLTRLVLTNAIYFKGNWVKQFNEENTKEQNFTTDSGNIVKVQMMQRTDDEAKFNYIETNEVQILEMPYDGNDLSMLVILPKENNLIQIEKSINLEKLSEWKNKMKEQRVNIYIPKFKFETKYFMADTLKQMGMPIAFSAKADFSGMTGNRDLFISEVIHQAFVEVNEEGTEAAAATAVVILESVSVEPVIPTFFADHPFIFIIQEKETGNILFMGRVGNPNK